MEANVADKTKKQLKEKNPAFPQLHFNSESEI